MVAKVVQLPLTLPFTFSRHVGAASRTSSTSDMAHSRHAYDRDQGCCALDPPADDCASSAQPLGHPHQDQHPGNGLNTTCIEPEDCVSLRQDITARLDFIARRHFIYSVYSDRPEAAPSPVPDCHVLLIKIVRIQFLPTLPARNRFFMIH